MDSIRGLFTDSGGVREPGDGEGDPVRERLGRAEQIASGVRMAAAALEEDLSELRRGAEEAAEAVLEAARSRAPGPEERDAERGGGAPGREAAEALSRSVDALEDLHYRLLRIEVHPEVRSEEERERTADRAREAVERAREVADSLAERTAA